MKLTKFAFTLVFAAVATSASAQYEGTSWEQRIGTGQDSIEARQNLSLFQMSYDNKQWPEAYESWKSLIEKAPCAQKGIYTKGAFMLYNLITAEQDKPKKLQYFKDLMMLFDTRVKNLDALNSFENEKGKSTMGDVLSLKADYYNWTAPTVEGSEYTLNKSYANYREAITMINEKGGREIEGSVLQNFFLVSDAMYKAGPNAMREQYLQDYLDSKDACEKMLQLAKEAQADGDNEKAEKLIAKYDGPLAFIEQTFTQSGAADSAQIVAIYTKKFDTYKTDINKLNSALTLMAQNECDNSDIYFQYAEAAYQIEPTFTSAIGLAQKAQADGKATQCLEYYNKALELATSDQTRGAICMRIAKALASSGAYNKSGEYIEKSIQYNPDLAGRAYYQHAVSLVHAHDMKGAMDICAKAASADITIAPQANRLKSQIQEIMSAQAQNAKLQAEYQEYLRKKKAEEDFWNQK